MVAAGSVSETSSSPRIYATLSMRRRSESGHLWRATSCALQAKIEGFHFHDLRHTFATILVQSGIDLYKVQLVAGAQIARHDATVFASLSGEFTK